MNSQKCRNSREALVHCMRRLVSAGLTTGTSGNASVRDGDGMLITPTGVLPEDMRPGSMVSTGFDGEFAPEGLAPSSEWQLHAAIYLERPEVAAIVHCHSRHATVLACCRRDIPPFHYMIAAAGGASIRCSSYATYGSEALARNALDALEGRSACLLANHGQLSVGPDLEEALRIAREVEELAAQYWSCLAIGGPTLLGRDEMDAVLKKFSGYGQPQPARR